MLLKTTGSEFKGYLKDEYTTLQEADDRIMATSVVARWRYATAEVDWVRAIVDMDRLADITGNSVDSYYGFTKMLWLKNQRPEIWKRIRWFVPPNAFVIQHLTGELAVDRSSAGNIGGVYDRKAAAWSADAKEALTAFLAKRPPDFTRIKERPAAAKAS